MCIYCAELVILPCAELVILTLLATFSGTSVIRVKGKQHDLESIAHVVTSSQATLVLHFCLYEIL